MEPGQRVLEQLKPGGEAETVWLERILTFITEHVHPLLSSGPAPSGGSVCPDELCVRVVKEIQNMTVTHSLPVSYRLISVSELLSKQHLACVSNLSWSTNQQRAWEKEAELALPGQRALPRVNLLLIGWLREGQAGDWRLTDASGSVRFECLSPSLLWLNHLVFLPQWNYIPHNALGQDGTHSEGHVELIGSPVLLHPAPEQGLAAGPGEGAGLSGAVGVRQALGLMKKRTRGQRLSVWGTVASVCPLLVVSGTSFFCFWLTDGSHSLPLLVKDSSRLWWSQCVCVGQSVCVTALRVCVLRGWRGNSILCVTERSEIHTDYTHTQENTHSDTESDTPSLEMMSHGEDGGDTCKEAEPGRSILQSGVRVKQSRVISYQGTVTEVVSEGAGLYVIDRKVGLCLAYQPGPRRKLRVGDSVELHHVHFLYRPCPDFPPSMLCMCLRSSLRVTSFSRVGGSSPVSTCPGDGVLPRLLLEKNVGVSEYLWTCHLSSQLSHSLLPSVMKQQCVCVLSWRLMVEVWGRTGGGRRDIYAEMLDEPHTCPLTQYRVVSAVRQYISVSELSESLQSECWSSVSLSSLLPPDGPSLTSDQINSALAWSCRKLTSDLQKSPEPGLGLRQRPLLLVGVLELPTQTSDQSLQLRDRTGAISCVVTETSQEEEGGQTAVFNTAWIGCLVCIKHFTMVTERFLQSGFPSHQHLDQEKYITHRNCRVYLQFSLDHVHILSPSVAMVTHLQQKGEESGGDVTKGERTEEEEVTKKRKKEAAADSSHSVTGATTSASCRPSPCVSMVIRMEQKEGVTWRNMGVGLKDREAGLTLSFSVRAAVIGAGVSWGRDPKNGPMTASEADSGRKEKVLLVFSGVSARWFPLLQPGSFYRLVAPNTQDRSVLIGCSVPGRSQAELHTGSTLQVQSDWRFHTLTRPLLLQSYRQALSPTYLSLSDVIDGCSSDVVCFQALVSDRISLSDRTSGSGPTGVRLTVCDETGTSLQVYLDLGHAPYPAGMLPGNRLLLSAFQRRVSRSGGVYCRGLPVSSVSVLSLGETSSAQPPPPPPMMHLGEWAASRRQRCSVGRVKGHVVCFLFLQLQWICSLCGSLYRQCCSSSQCHSTSSVFDSKAKLVIDDGTGEAHVSFSGVLVCTLLGLADSQWAGLQRAVRVRGHIRVFPRGRSLVCDPDDPLLHYLVCVCSSEVVCRQLSLSCSRNTRQRAEGTKRFTRGERDFITRMAPPPQLTCQHIL